jgi:hypothetical protein
MIVAEQVIVRQGGAKLDIAIKAKIRVTRDFVINLGD